jgi:glycosyltransferase involved in cell wall biosynthesis
MRVAIFVHCFFPEHFYGTETYTLDLARSLRALGHDAVVVSAVFPGERERSSLVTQYEYQGIPVLCIDKNKLPNRRVKDTYYQPEMAEVLEQVLRDIRPDIVHVTHLINHTAALLEVTAKLRLPTVATFTDFFGFCFNNKLEAADGELCFGPNRRRTNCYACYLKASAQNPGAGLDQRVIGLYPLSRLAATFLDTARKVPWLTKGSMAGTLLDITTRPDTLLPFYSQYRAAIAPTHFLAEAYRRNRIPVQLTESPFGVDVDRTEKPKRSREWKLRLGFIGQLDAHKGVHILLDAFSQLPRDAAELHIFGPENQNPAYTTKLKSVAADLPVRFRGTFEAARMAAVFSELDLLVIPSVWYENSPLVLLYALATHTPVIVSDVPGLTEFVHNGVNGFVFERGSVNSLSAVLQRIAQSPSLASQMAASTSYERTTLDMANDVAKMYARVLKGVGTT